MRFILLLITLLSLNLSCGNFDVSNNPEYNYGFKVNHVYEIQKTLFFDKKLRHIRRIKKEHSDYFIKENFLLKGTKFKVLKLTYNNKSGLISSHAIILDGKFKGRKANTTFLTKNGYGKNSYPDKELVKDLGPDK